MKNLILAFVALVSFGNVAFSQAKNQKQKAVATKVIAMVNTAKWCPACQANGKRVEQNVISKYMTNNKCQVVVNDLSDDNTKAASKANCDKAGITSVASSNTSTGVIYFINSSSKKVISQVSVTKTDKEIQKAFDDAIRTI